MANPFGKMQEYFSSPNRATHDWSFQNNLTLKMGKITPCCYIPLTPGESVRIKPTFGFNFEPMIFPVQTRMRAHLHFFYVRYKDLYKDWLDKFGMTKQGLEMPYMKLTEDNRDMINTGEIGDYFNIPTVTYGSFGSQLVQNGSFIVGNADNKDLYGVIVGSPSVGYNLTNYLETYPVSDSIPSTERKLANFSLLPPTLDKTQQFSISLDSITNSINCTGVSLIFININEQIISLSSYRNVSELERNGNKYHYPIDEIPADTAGIVTVLHIPSSVTLISDLNFSVSLNYYNDGAFAIENSDQPLNSLPFCSSANEDGERLVNFPFRAYEFVYNSFYRDERNNPYKIDGQIEYNKYLPSTDGGADTYHYKLRNINWEQDFLTTATHSPQFGVAPLVGITSTGTMTFADEEGNTYTAQAKVGDDGDTITGISVHSPDMPTGTLRALIDTVSSGISISDFRNVNALQRLLEKRMRHGLKYVDMVQASFGTRPKNLEISMPEFIGGVNHDVIVNAVSQTTDTLEVPLGTKGGTASVLGSSEHSISCYADDFGCIIGLVYIAPVPNYSQLLPKHFFASEALDYFHPEFGHIGYQPIYNKEVAPLQFFRDDKANNTDNYNSVFGYQRPWYDMISKTDEVHGNFRNNKRRYLINRVFDTPPALTEDFLLVDADQVNDVFAVTYDTDKIFGQVYFDIKRKNAVPTLAIPRLES